MNQQINFFNDVIFDEKKHLYYDKNNQQIKYSVSQIVNLFYERKYETAPYYILKQARKKGVIYHNLIKQYLEEAKTQKDFNLGDYTFLANDKIKPMLNVTYKFIKRWLSQQFNNFNFDYLFIEQPIIYHDIAGTLDFFYYDIENQTYYIIDWKTNNPLYENETIKNSYHLQTMLYGYLVLCGSNINKDNISTIKTMLYNPRKKDTEPKWQTYKTKQLINTINFLLQTIERDN